MFQIERCKGVNEFSNVDSIIRPHWSQSFYSVKCEYGYYPRYGERNYECRNGHWSPQIICEPVRSRPIWTSSNNGNYNKQFNPSKRDKNVNVNSAGSCILTIIAKESIE